VNGVTSLKIVFTFYMTFEVWNGGSLSETDFPFLGAFAKLRKAIIGFVMFVCLSVRPSVRVPSWNNSAPAGRIFIKLDI
jgi:hypothetical protein